MRRRSLFTLTDAALALSMLGLGLLTLPPTSLAQVPGAPTLWLNCASHQLSYNPNLAEGGSVPQSPQWYRCRSRITVANNSGDLQKTGYSLSAWNTAADGSGTAYPIGATLIMGTSNLTLFAQWTTRNFSVMYAGNGNTGGTVPAIAHYPYASSVSVASNSGNLAKTGYNFAGWNTAADGNGTTFAAGTGSFSMGSANLTLYALWTVNNYTLTYDGHGSTSGTVPGSGSYAFNSIVTAAANSGTLLRTGYTFAGWNTQANGSGSSYAAGSASFNMPAQNTTLYAQWTVNNYTLTYDSNGSSGGSAPSGGTYAYNAVVAVAGNTGSLLRSGYTFAGWNTSAAGNGSNYTPGTGSLQMPAANTTLYARWTLNNYTLSYDANSSTGGAVPEASPYPYSTQVTVAANSGSLTKNGYSFGGWNSTADGGGSTYAAGSGTLTMPAADITLFAKWNLNSYILSYNANGATGGMAPSATPYNYNATVSVATNIGSLVKTGHSFAAWNTSADGSGTTYTAGSGSFPMPAGDTTLYAVWTVNNYNVSYDSNGSNSGTVPSSTAYAYGSPVIVADNSGGLTRNDGTYLVGWNTLAQGNGSSYALGTGTFMMGTGDITLYAQWGNTPLCGGSHDSCYSNAAAMAAGAAVTPSGKNLVYIDADGAGAGNFKVWKESGVNRVLNPSGFDLWLKKLNVDGRGFTAIDFTDANLGTTNTTIAGRACPGNVLIDAVNKFTTNNCLYYSPSYASQTLNAAGTSQSSLGTIGLAAWDGAGTGNETGASWYEGNLQTCAAKGMRLPTIYETSVDPAPTTDLPSDGGTPTQWGLANGIPSSGWTWTATASPVSTPQYWMWSGAGRDYFGYSSNRAVICIIPDAQTYYAVTYNGNGNSSGSVPTDISAYIRGQSVTTQTVGTLVRTGYDFTGWNTAANASGSGYAANTSFAMGTSSITLYAQWSKVNYTVSYDGNGSTAGTVPNSGSYTYGQTVSVASNSGTLVRDGYTFAGWNTQANGGGSTYTAGTGTFSMPAQNTMLFALWSVNSYTLSYQGNSNSSGSAPQSGTHAYNSNLTVASNSGSLARTGYTFSGWNTVADGSGISYAAGTGTLSMPAANTTLYAKWSINSYTLSYAANGSSSGSAPNATPYNYNATVTVAANTGTLAKTGYTFGGWNTAADGSGSNYVAGSGTLGMPASDTTLFAKWNLNSYNLSYNANGSTSGTVPAAAAYNYNATVTVATNSGALVKTVYSLVAWNTNAAGTGTSYVPGSGALVMGDADLTLYAQWSTVPSCGGPGDSCYSNATAIAAGAALTPTGKNLVYIDVDGAGAGTFKVWKESGGDRVLNPSGFDLWLKNLNVNGRGFSTTDFTDANLGTTSTLIVGRACPGNVFIDAANKFTTTNCLYYSPTYTAQPLNAAGTSQISLGTLGLANWDAASTGNDTDLSWYEGNIHTCAVKAMRMPTLYETAAASPADLNALVSADGSPTVWGGANIVPAGNMVFTATAKPSVGASKYFSAGRGGDAFTTNNPIICVIPDAQTYSTVTYNGNGSTGGTVPSSASYYSNTAVTTAANTGSLVKTGSYLQGWNTAAAGNGTSYALGTGTFVIGAANVTLYAQWATTPTCGGVGDSCYSNAAAIATGVAVTPAGKNLVYIDADGAGAGTFKVWKESGGNRILNPSGFDLWTKNLNIDGNGQSVVDFTDANLGAANTVLSGRACPGNVYLDAANKFASTQCLYYSPAYAAQRLDATAHDGVTDQTTVGAVRLGTWISPAGGNGTGASWYEGNIQTCAAKGARLPTIYETSVNPAPNLNLPSDGGAPTQWGLANGVPSTGVTWTASASSGGSDKYWTWKDTNHSGTGYNSTSVVICVIPDAQSN